MILRTCDDLEALTKEEATELLEDVCEEDYELIFDQEYEFESL